ncbi:class I SAM-dependent methyltransferase [Kiloniella laminariae]|uniref:class I SAM-dependent methyltransferase n=1 Tax=Kiloniella laminariae TaxID=454162 RepID=UPI000365FBC0|nr:class I SAM-dependent methyltransferase [Kiloniella laminariae]
MTREKQYLEIVSFYENCLKQHGTGHAAVNWGSKEAAEKRYKVMADLIPAHQEDEVSLLDFGCGLGAFKAYLQQNNAMHIRYCGLDLSPAYIEKCRELYPNTEFYCIDILEDENVLPEFDYIIINGVFTRSNDLGYNQMCLYLEQVLQRLSRKIRLGLAFNVMSNYVDWEGEGLFHPKLDDIAKIVENTISRNFIIRNDYGLYETTCYVYR